MINDLLMQIIGETDLITRYGHKGSRPNFSLRLGLESDIRVCVLNCPSDLSSESIRNVLNLVT